MAGQVSDILAGKLTPLAAVALRVGLILGGAVLATLIFGRAVHSLRVYFLRMLRRRPDPNDLEIEKQATTIAGVVRKTAAVLIWALAGVMSLREMGFDITPLITGVGVAGVAIGFGAQNLVRDVIAGFFILIENQIRVNDVAVINDTPGVVEEINLRTTVLRDAEGTVHVFPNGGITKLANRTQGFSYYLFTLSLSYRDDTGQAIDLLKQAAAEVASEEPYLPWVLAPIEIFGVDQLGETHVLLKARIKTQPGRQWDVGREINRRLKVLLDRAGFDLPARGPRHIEIVTPSGSGAMTREELKTLLREVVRETDGHANQPQRR